MLGAIGTPAFTTHAIALYGRPDDRCKTQTYTALEATDFFLQKTDQLLGSYVVPPTVADIPVESFAERLRNGVDAIFEDEKVEVVIDAELAPYFETGFIDGPHYVPHWARDLRTLASAFACNADLSEVTLENFIALGERTVTGNG